MPGPVSRTDIRNEPLFASAFDDFACIGEFDGIENEINQDLRQAAAVAVPWRQFAGKFKFECELLVGRQWLQRAANRLGCPEPSNRTVRVLTGQPRSWKGRVRR